MPTNTTSPSWSSRAGTAAIISSGVWPAVPVVPPGAQAFFRLEPRDARLVFQVRGAVGDAVHKLVEVTREPDGIARNGLPGDVEFVVAVVVDLRVRRARSARLGHHRVHDHAGDNGPVRITSDQ